MARKTFAEPQAYKSHGAVIGYMIQWLTPDKKRKTRVFPFVAYRSERETYDAALAELRRAIGEAQAYRDGTKTFVRDDGMTLGQFYEKHWLPERNAKKRQPRNDQSVWSKHLKNVFADTPLKTLVDPVHVRRFQTKIVSEANKPATARNVMALLKAMLNHAADLGYLPNVPRVKRVKVERKGFNVLKSDAEIDAFLKAAKKQDFEHYALYAVACYTGMRLGEIIALRWRDVDLDAGRIMVRFSHENATKSGKPRPVPIFVKLAPILKQWRKLRKDKPNELGLVFPPKKKGKLYRNDTEFFTKHYRAALIKAKLETNKTPKTDRLRFHDLRHSFASMFLSHGGSLQELKEILGHASLSTTNIYSHFVPNSFRGASGAFALAKPPQPPEPPPDDAKVAQSRPAARPKRPRKPKKVEPTLRLVK